MDDHFWPSIYPGIIVGLLLGLSQRTFVSTLLGGVGGLVGAFCLFYIIMYLAVDRGIISVFAVVGGAILTSKLFLKLGSSLIKKNHTNSLGKH